MGWGSGAARGAAGVIEDKRRLRTWLGAGGGLAALAAAGVLLAVLPHAAAWAATGRARTFYQRWLGWAIGYALARGLKDGGFAQACEASAGARSQFPRWPAEFMAQAIWHLSTHAERRGRPL